MWKASVRIVSRTAKPLHNGKVIITRDASGKPNSRPGSHLLSIGGAAAVTIVGGSVLLAKVSDGFRRIAENSVPGAAELFTSLIGPSVPQIQVAANNANFSEGLLKKKLEREASRKDGDILIVKSSGDPSLEPPKLSTDFLQTTVEVQPNYTKQEAASESDNPVVAVDAVAKDDRVEEQSSQPAELSNEVANAEQQTPTAATDNVLITETVQAPESTNVGLADIDPAEFAKLVGDLRSKATDAVNAAVTAQESAAASIRKHVELVFKSLEKVYDPNETQGNVWEPVFQATQEKTEAVREAEIRHKEARIAVAQLKEAVAYGLKDDHIKQSPDLITFDETVARALYSLETANAKVEAAQSEAKVMDEYRELVDTARRNLQIELSSIRPELAPSFKTEDTKLGEEELNILMAHAYWKIITLQKELARQQGQEQQRLKAALETQRKEDSSVLESRLRVELERQYYELKAQYTHDIAMHEKILSEQFTQQLKRQAAAYTDHLSDSLATQQDELKRKFEGERELERAKLTSKYHEQLAKLHGMAKGVQDAVHDRAGKDQLSRQVRELWVAAQAMVDSLQSNKAVHLPWEQQRRPIDLKAINQLCQPEDEFLKTVIESIPKDAMSAGVLPQGAIKDRFIDVERLCRRVALIDDNGGSLLRYGLSYLQSMLVIKADVRPSLKEDEEIDVGKLNTFDILARTRYHLEKDDLEQALRYVNLLTGAPQNVAADWVKDLRVHLETVQAAQAVLAYAGSKAIESM